MSNGKKPAKAGDESYAVLQSLIAKGRKEGMLRASELNAELEKLDISPEKIEEIYDVLDRYSAIVIGHIQLPLRDAIFLYAFQRNVPSQEEQLVLRPVVL